MSSKFPKKFWWGVGLFVVGSGPLLAIIVAAELGLTSDPNPNPVGFGMLAGLTFWPAIIMIIVGFVKKSRRPPPGGEPPVLGR